MHRVVLILLSVWCWMVAARSIDISINESNSVYLSARIFPPLSIIVVDSSNERCRDDSRTLLENLRNFTTWAMQMYDASAASSNGFLIGSAYQMGDWYECIENEGPIRAQYCLVTLTIEPPSSVIPSKDAHVFFNPLGSAWNKIWHMGDPQRVPRNVVSEGLCVPASCRHTDVQASISRHLEESSANRTIRVDVPPSFCHTKRDPEPLSTGSIYYCCIMASILLLVVVSTVCDKNKYMHQVAEEESSKLKNTKSYDAYATLFSLKRSWFNLFKPSKTDLGCINGIKVLTMIMIITSHRLLFDTRGPLYNYERFEREKFYFEDGFLQQIDVCVDSFFMISGMLAAFLLLQMLQKKSMNLFTVIVLRYLRLTPVYAVIIFFYVTLMFHAGQGPLWIPLIGEEREYCQENWWTNLLYVNNYVNDGRLCMLHSWYLAVDFQLYTVSTFLVFLIHKRPRLGNTVLGLVLAASIINPFAISYLQRLDAILFFNKDLYQMVRTHSFFQRMYTKSHVHATPYLLGLIAGLVLYRKRRHFKKYTWQSNVGLVCGCLVSLGSLIPGCFILSNNWDYSDVMGALEQPQRRFFWPLGVALVIVSLIFSKNSILDKFLSCHVMSVLSRLCYSSYLASLCIQQMLDASGVAPGLISIPNVLKSAVLDILLSLFAALVLYLTVEAPVLRLLTKVLLRKKTQSSSAA